MDVGATVSRSLNASSLSATLTATKSTSSANITAADGTNLSATSQSEAFSLEISSTGVSVNMTEGQTHGDAVKGLTSEQVDALQEGIDKAYETMIKVLTEQNLKMQGWLDEGIGKFNFDGVQIGADSFGLPAVGTTPEEAQAAISEGGAYSVDAVADRLFDLASAIAGDDIEKLQKMQSAIDEGFKAASSFWKDATGQDEMPEITKQTQEAISQRFTDRYAELLKNLATSASTRA